MNHLYKSIIIIIVEVMTGGLLVSAQSIKLKKPVPAQSHIFHMGEKINPMGETLEVDSKGMLHNGNPIIPVMGEFHFARCPEKNWHDELMKIKAGVSLWSLPMCFGTIMKRKKTYMIGVVAEISVILSRNAKRQDYMSCCEWDRFVMGNAEMEAFQTGL